MFMEAPLSPGHYKGKELNIVSAFEAVGEFTSGRLNEEDLKGIEQNACPGSGSCGGMYTANTMSSSFEALGMSLPYSSTMANEDAEKVVSAHESAIVLVEAIKKNLRPRDIITKKINRECSECDHGSRRLNQCRPTISWPSLAPQKLIGRLMTLSVFVNGVPVIVDMKPSGTYLATDLHQAGGIPTSDEDFARRWTPPRRLHDHHRQNHRGSIKRRALCAARRSKSDPHLWITRSIQHRTPWQS
jgi:dihydroxy-acid dehydratase